MQIEQISGEEAGRLLLSYQKSRNQELRNSLVMYYLPIVKKAAVQLYSMAGNLLEREDLTGQGVLALMEALDKYDPDFGAKFETYAFIRVRGAMIDYIRSQDWVPHRARNFQKKIDEAVSELANEKMREPDAREVAAFLDIPAEKIESHLQYMNHATVFSFEALLQDMPERELLFAPEAEVASRPEASFFNKDLLHNLTLAVDSLSERERLVVSLYYYEELKYSEIAEVLDVGQSRVCQIHTKAIQKLKESMEAYLRG